MKQWKQVQEETKLQTVWPYQQARGGWEGSKEHGEKPEVKMAWMNSTNTQSNGLASLFAFLVTHRWCHPGYFKELHKWLSLVFCCVESKLNGDRSLVTGAQHVHVARTSCCCSTYRRSSFSPKLYKEAHLDRESSKVLKDKSVSYFISQRRWWG